MPTSKAESLKLKNKEYKLSRLLTREVSMSNFSKEDNYHGGVSVSVPFRWETEPGTPKIRSREMPLPPLTPPPSYYFNSPRSSISIKKHPKPNILGTILPKRVTTKKQLPSSPPSSSSSSSSSASFSWSSSSPLSTSYSVISSASSRLAHSRGRSEMSIPRLSFDSRFVGEEEQEYESHVSTLCFGRVANARSRSGCYSSLMKVLLRDSQ